MTSVESAYQVIADCLAGRATKGWDKVVFETKILARSCSSMSTTESIGGSECGLSLGMQPAFSISDAAIFLRDDLLKNTGDRIWGLTFTLFPDGKFRIEYDYNKPADYEETDETIEVDFNKDVPGAVK